MAASSGASLEERGAFMQLSDLSRIGLSAKQIAKLLQQNAWAQPAHVTRTSDKASKAKGAAEQKSKKCQDEEASMD